MALARRKAESDRWNEDLDAALGWEAGRRVKEWALGYEKTHGRKPQNWQVAAERDRARRIVPLECCLGLVESWRTAQEAFRWEEEQATEEAKEPKKAPNARGLARSKGRRAILLRAIPSWADHIKIKGIYRIAMELRMHVDHIVPLVSKVVCGFHWERNLQLLNPVGNMRKGNKLLAEVANGSYKPRDGIEGAPMGAHLSLPS